MWQLPSICVCSQKQKGGWFLPPGFTQTSLRFLSILQSIQLNLCGEYRQQWKYPLVTNHLRQKHLALPVVGCERCSACNFTLDKSDCVTETMGGMHCCACSFWRRCQPTKGATWTMNNMGTPKPEAAHYNDAQAAAARHPTQNNQNRAAALAPASLPGWRVGVPTTPSCVAGIALGRRCWCAHLRSQIRHVH